ncbi:hypothetical protein [Aquimarina sp. MMG016]|uniref:hypothetical protein n=1 Tax=Aquimarina sp. MMG016 TaxID=2822690 RepID=UPI001B3A2B52|nr:hypothetical protein [Aquimarina sp. MMG016]MBQ4821838.1 hypothetical protein [Aquimarina sp. MMG016]
MNIKSLVYSLFILTSILQAQRQSVLNNAEELSGYNQIPQEKVYIHYNTTVLFAGEYLHYSVFCFNTVDNAISNISKIAYVELVNEKGKAVFKHKIKLEKGLGQGDFFLPVAVPSGNYKLIGYTQWMLNADNNFFYGDISIINPYQGDQKEILSAQQPLDSITESSLVSTQTNPLENASISESNGIKLSINAKVFQKRSHVVLTMGQTNSSNRSGSYSVSVRKKNAFNTAKSITAKDFSELYATDKKSGPKSLGASVFLPEMRGELLYGRVIPKQTDLKEKLVNVSLSIPGKTNDVKVVSTDEKGVFVFNIDKVYKSNEVILQVLGEQRDKYTITLSEAPEANYPKMEFYKFKITRAVEKDIVNRSVSNQVENSFFNIKPDTIQEPKEGISFYGSKLETYLLDDYTRFSTVKETIVEVVNGVFTRRNNAGEKVFAIRGYYPTQENYDFVPLLIVDGVVVQEHEDIINYDARKVKSISFIRDRYFLGTKVFEGILILETIDEDYTETLNKSYILKKELIRPQLQKKHYRQQYTAESKAYDRIPDYRYQLLWKPNITIEKQKTTHKFFTSDITGDFEICIEGFENDGTPISIKEYFTVE